MPRLHDLPTRLHELSAAIDKVILADHSQRHWLKDNPSLNVTYADALKHYGGPCVGLDLWCMCAAVQTLREVWLGSDFQPPPIAKGADDEPRQVPQDGAGSVDTEVSAAHPST